MTDDVLFIDIETQSAVEIRNVLQYVNHPSTRILSAVGRYKGVTTTWIPTGRAPHVASLREFNQLNSRTVISDDPPFDTEVPWVAHNAFGFDSLVWDRLYAPPVQWLDTAPMCRAIGLPAALDAVSKLLFGEGKIAAGKELIKIMCKALVGRNGQYSYPVGTVHLWRQLIEYNIQDVELLERLYNVVAPHFHEWDLLQIDQEINRRGIMFDMALVQKILSLWNEVQRDAYDEVEILTEGALKTTDLRSTQKVTRWLSSQGVNLDSLNKHNLAESLAEYDAEDTPSLPTILAVLEARQTATRSSRGKVERLVEIAVATRENRLRNALVFHGAHTGRWSGRGVQPHNIARISNPAEMDRILSLPTESLTVKDLGEHPADRLSELMRPCFVASPGKRLLIGDYAQVEARGLAWLADDADRIKLFNDESRDLYCESASTLFGRKITKADKQYRQVGKVMELGLGYGMGGPKFNRFALQSKVDLKALGLDATAVVKQWRESVPKITGLWKSYEAGCRDAILNRSTQVSGRARFDYSNGALQIRLPSGRRLWYRNARIENRIPMYVYVLGLEPHTKPTIVYDHPHGREGILYGGLIVENVVQATCRDLLAFHLTECQRTGLDVALHVHDEIVCDTEAGVSVLHEIMSRLPGWAHRFPHKVEVHESERYNK